jgi:hypothetical protein
MSLLLRRLRIILNRPARPPPPRRRRGAPEGARVGGAGPAGALGGGAARGGQFGCLARVRERATHELN